MTWKNIDFAEGDSGVPMPGTDLKIWNEIEMEKKAGAQSPPELVNRDPIEMLAELAGRLMAIGVDKQNDPLARATALVGAHNVLMDQLKLSVAYQGNSHGLP